ncbi:hypothetical protein F4777DRAFT_378689 [Nemania sp. FL0916]|nr:hypothetical protein F4777DRAFT_378689 [Nemania sp. FL0916]
MANNPSFLWMTGGDEFGETYDPEFTGNLEHQPEYSNHFSSDFSADILAEDPGKSDCGVIAYYPLPDNTSGVPASSWGTSVTGSSFDLNSFEDALDHVNPFDGRSDANGTTNDLLGTIHMPMAGSRSRTTTSTPSLLASPISPRTVSPRATVQGQRYLCSDCDGVFQLRKDLLRHSKTVHPTRSSPMFSCRCGKQGPRKDNHKRHVRSCRWEHRFPFYVCNCGYHCDDGGQYVDHLCACDFNQGLRGRPRTN